MSQTKPISYGFFFLLLLILSTPTQAADFTYEIYDPRAQTADDYLITQQNVGIRVESDFVYWTTSNDSEPHILLFHFPFEKEIDTAHLVARTDTFNWNRQAYAKIEASKDGSNWILLKETGPPDYGGWNSGTYSGDLPTQLLGSKELYVRITLSVYAPDGITPVSSNNTQALRHQISINNRTFALEVNFKEPQQAKCVLPIGAITGLLLNGGGRTIIPQNPTTELIDPVAIGGAGTTIIYRDEEFTGPTTIAPGSIVGIKKDGEYFLYHPSMGTGVTFSEETNKEAVLYSFLNPTGPSPSNKALAYTSDKDVALPAGVRVTTDGRDGKIKLENTLQRWCALKVMRSDVPEIHYLSPATPIMADDAQFLRYALKGAADYSFTGSEIVLDTNGVTSIEIYGSYARATAIIAINGYPPNAGRAVNRDYNLLQKVCLLDLSAVAYVQFCNITKAAIPLECLDSVFDLLSTQVQLSIVNQISYDDRLANAIAHEGNSSLMLGLLKCTTEFKTAGAAALLYTYWDIAKALCDFSETVVLGTWDQSKVDAYNQIDIHGIDSISVTSPPNTTEFLQFELLDLSGMVITVQYNTISPASTFVFNTTEYQSLGVVTTPDYGTTLSLSDTHIDVSVPEHDVRYLQYEDEYLLHLGLLYDSTFTHRIPITVTEYTGPVLGSCSNPITSNQMTIHGYGGGHTYTLNFGDNTYKMCTEVVSDADSMNGETVMLYFFKSDGSGTYTVPWLQSSTYNWATLSASENPTNLNVSVSPLPDYNSSTVSYFTPETNFGFKVINYETLSDTNDGDFLWLKYQNSSGDWIWTIVNTEWVNADGSYTGNY